MKARELFPLVPGLFERSKAAWEKPYNELIYGIERPLARQNIADVVQWLDGGKLPTLGPREVARINDVMQAVRWPDVRPLARLKGIDGLTLPRAAAVMHFHNPSFPTFQDGAVQGLALVGRRVRRPLALGLEPTRAYRRYLEVLGELKEAIPYTCVPESHYFLSWVLEASLAQLAAEQGAHA